jgi:hypothetical protein
VEWEQLHRSRLTAQDLYAGLLIEIAGFNYNITEGKELKNMAEINNNNKYLLFIICF